MKIFIGVIKNPKNSKILIATLLLGCAFLAGFFYECQMSYTMEKNRATVETINLTRVLQEHVNGSFQSTDLVLRELKTILETGRHQGEINKNKYNKIFLERRLRLPEVRSFKAADKNGEYIVDDGGLQNYSNLSDRAYFHALKHANDDELVISQPVISRTNHIWVVVLARRLVDSKGNFDGVILGTIPLSYFKNQFEKLDLGEEGLIGLYDMNMVTHVRIPWEDKNVGRKMELSQRFKNFINSNHSYITLDSASPLDGITRLMTFRKLGDYDFIVGVGVSDQQFMASWKKRTIIYLTFIVLSFTVFGLFLFMYLWSQEELEVQRHQAIQASKLSSLGEMAGGVAHEINNPLTIISALATRTKKNLKDSTVSIEKSEENLDKIINTVDRIAKIIRGLRAFSRDSNGDAFSKKSVQELIDMALELCGERYKENGIQLRVEWDSKAEVECREVQIVQVLVNLLNNSLDAISSLKEKWIKISTKETDKLVFIYVSDSGKGISEEVSEKMMMPFFTTKEVGKGTGLGLSISKGIIEAHHGKFYYQQDEEGHTCFVLELKKSLKYS